MLKRHVPIDRERRRRTIATRARGYRARGVLSSTPEAPKVSSPFAAVPLLVGSSAMSTQRAMPSNRESLNDYMTSGVRWMSCWVMPCCAVVCSRRKTKKVVYGQYKTCVQNQRTQRSRGRRKRSNDKASHDKQHTSDDSNANARRQQ